MIIYIFGEDTFRSRQYLKEQVGKFKQARDPQGYNVVFVEGKKSEQGKVLSELSSAPFLAEKRMIVVENILSSSDKELLGNLMARIKDKKIPESIVAVFWQGDTLSKVKEAKELHELLKKEKYTKELIPLVGAQLSAYIMSEAAKKGAKISRAAATFLAQNIGADMWQLNSLLEQLAAYKAGEEIQLADLQLFLDEKVDDNIFNMIEAMVSGNKKQAFKLLNEQRRLGEEEMKIFGLVVWQFRQLISIRSLFDTSDTMRSDEMAKELGLHPFVVKKNLAVVKRFPLQKLKDIYSQLLQMDIKIKTGQGEPDLLMDLLVQKI